MVQEELKSWHSYSKTKSQRRRMGYDGQTLLYKPYCSEQLFKQSHIQRDSAQLRPNTFLKS